MVGTAEWGRFHDAISVGASAIAYEIAQTGFQSSQKRSDFGQAGSWLKAAATALYHQGKIAQSAATLERAVAIQPDEQEKALSLVGLAGRKGFLLGQVAALLELGRAQEISDSYPRNARLKGVILHHKALALEVVGEVGISLSDCIAASKVLLQEGLFRDAAISLNSAGLYLADAGRVDEGLKLVADALEMAKKERSLLVEGGIQDSLGYIHLLRGDWNRAEELLRNSHEIFRAHSYNLELAGNLLNLSLLYERTRKWDAARIEAQKAVELADSLGIEQLRLRSRRQLESVLANTPRPSTKPEVFHGIIYTSSQMRQVITRIKTIALVDEPVLLLGETGTGKELAARAIHFESKRRSMPFIPFNCAALSREFVESRLFGHRRGAFTGADRDHVGVIRAAAGGTVFLDEIGDLSLDVQAVLLRFLQSGEVQPLGFNSPVKTDVRIIAATNRNLRKESEAGRFRKDLYYRLNVATITLPRLWSRKDDIRLLASHFAEIYTQQYGGPNPVLGESELSQMVDYDWPGNVRELENYVKRRILYGEGEAVDSDRPVNAGAISTFRDASEELAWRFLEVPEKERLLNQVLVKTQGNITHAARHLGISRRTIQRLRRGKKIPPS